jgi:hypothetical protein
VDEEKAKGLSRVYETSAIVGSVVCSGWIVLSKQDLNTDTAKKTGLTLPALEAAFKAGYVFAWIFEAPRALKTPMEAKKSHMFANANSTCGVVWSRLTFNVRQ